ncbi:ATP-binding protein [Allokutzneria sp. A3M-2-11 16]|uniref:sensor histidine kinase n=1 Tax=Allokutzneria sp. A3M-2-11 16 TaxID=2962043 RepID=UPI0020B638C5|nr:ATP-binding protein [Allokutzneria sp. A3M-2-11 16]MCP3802041.1 ATP-binding protein [Allokutzneria sp. A3M-2-11 16]
MGEATVADSGGAEAPPLPTRHNAVVDPLNVDQELRGIAEPDAELIAMLLREAFQLEHIVNGDAVRYTPEGGRVSVRARQDGEHVLFEVADTGVDIDPEDLPHVFERFWRAEKSRSRSTGGSGLGLAITRQVVRAQGGTVSVTSEPGDGSTFRVLMPVRWSV